MRLRDPTADNLMVPLTLVRRRHAGVEVTTEFRELPADPRVDAVAIVTAVNTHYQVALAALKAGKHCAGRQAAHPDFCAIASLDRVMFINDRFPRATADSGKFAAAGRLETGTDTGLPASVDRIACDDLGCDDLRPARSSPGMSRWAPS